MMSRIRVSLTVTGLLFAGGCIVARAAEEPAFSRQEDVIYGRKDGVALTMDVFTPKAGANGAAAVLVVSGGWVSRHESIGPMTPTWIVPLIRRGYTVFAVVPGSQPRYTIPEITQDISRSVRFIRSRASQYRIDPKRLGIYGGSAGGHLSLIQALAAPKGEATSQDPVDKEDTRVQAVAAFYPPTDFFNYGKEGENALGRGILANFRAAFEYRRLDAATRTFVPLTPEQETVVGRMISPISYVTADDPPTLLFHGDADKLVPMQQSEILVEKLKSVGVKTRLVVKPGAAHGWPEMVKDVETIGDWFDEYLKK